MRKNKKRLATKVLSTALLSSLIITSLGEVTSVKASDTAHGIVQSEAGYKAGESELKNESSKPETTFSSEDFEAGQSYEVHNHSESTSLGFYLVAGYSVKGDVIIFDKNDDVYSISKDTGGINSYITIPPNGFARLVVEKPTGSVYITTDIEKFKAQMSVNKSNKGVLRTLSAEPGKYYDLENTSDKPVYVKINKNGSDSPDSVVFYNKDGVISDEHKRANYRYDFKIPANGKARFIQGDSLMRLSYSADVSEFIKVSEHDKDGKNMRAFEFTTEEIPSAYIGYKKIKVTNTGGDNLFRINTTDNITLLNPYVSQRYLKAGESAIFTIKPSKKDYTNFEGNLVIEEGNWEFNRKKLSIPMTFTAQENGTANTNVKHLLDETNEDGTESQSYSMTYGDSEVTYSYSVNKENKEEADKAGYSNASISTEELGDTRTHQTKQYFNGASLAYEGQSLNANDIVNGTYSINTDIAFTTSGGDAVIGKYGFGEVMERVSKYGALIAPLYINQYDNAIARDGLDAMTYKFESGEITGEELLAYTETVYTTAVNENFQTVLTSYERSGVTAGLKYLGRVLETPKLYKMGGMLGVAFVVNDWSVAVVNDAFANLERQKILVYADSVAKGQSDSFTYTDKYGFEHVVTATSNTIKVPTQE